MKKVTSHKIGGGTKSIGGGSSEKWPDGDGLIGSGSGDCPANDFTGI